MAVYAFTDAAIWLGDTDISAYSNGVNVDQSADALDSTTFGSTYRTRASGLKTWQADITGFHDGAAAGDPDDHLFGNLAAEQPMSLMPEGDGAALNAAYFGLVRDFQYQTGASVGELHAFSATASGSDGYGLVRGKLFTIPADRTTSADGTPDQLGSVAATERIFACLHVFSGSGGNLDVSTESDNSGVWGSPTTRHTFTQATGATSEIVSVAGALGDDYWRPTWTISAGTFNFAVLIGIATVT